MHAFFRNSPRVVCLNLFKLFQCFQIATKCSLPFPILYTLYVNINLTAIKKYTSC
uniref:Uncharacterized protein n=1 Tax=Arundo donax TaxID=35708 RepID=A0A0A9A2J0_ARUDO